MDRGGYLSPVVKARQRTASHIRLRFHCGGRRRRSVSRTVLRASAAGFTSAIFASLIEDDDSAELTLTLPSSIAEGSGAQGNITLSRPASYPVAVTLSASPSGLALASPVTIPAGFTSFDFYFSAQDDAVINPDFEVAVTATIPNWTTTMTRSLSCMSRSRAGNFCC